MQEGEATIGKFLCLVLYTSPDIRYLSVAVIVHTHVEFHHIGRKRVTLYPAVVAVVVADGYGYTRQRIRRSVGVDISRLALLAQLSRCLFVDYGYVSVEGGRGNLREAIHLDRSSCTRR